MFSVKPDPSPNKNKYKIQDKNGNSQSTNICLVEFEKQIQNTKGNSQSTNMFWVGGLGGLLYFFLKQPRMKNRTFSDIARLLWNYTIRDLSKSVGLGAGCLLSFLWPAEIACHPQSNNENRNHNWMKEQINSWPKRSSVWPNINMKKQTRPRKSCKIMYFKWYLTVLA